MKAEIQFEIDTDALPNYTDEYLASLWHIAQANPAPDGDRQASAFAGHVIREIIKRFLAGVGVS